MEYPCCEHCDPWDHADPPHGVPCAHGCNDPNAVSRIAAERDRLAAENARLIRRLKQLADHWQREYASETGWPSRCAIELREALAAREGE